MSDLRQPGEVSRGCSREYLRDCFFIEGRSIWIVIEEVTTHIFPVSLAGFFRPFMILGSMIHNEIHAHTDAFLMAGTCKLLQVIHSSQVFLNFSEICYSISAVRTTFRSIQKRHQMNIVDIVLFQIINLALHTLHISGKIIDIEHHTQHVVFLIPVRVCFSLAVQLFQSICTFFIETVHLVT